MEVLCHNKNSESLPVTGASVVSDSVQPHRQHLTRLPHPWDSPGKNTRVGCLFLLQCMRVKSESEVAQSCLTRSDPMDCSLPGSSIHGIFQARVLEWGAIAFSMRILEWCYSLLQGIFPTQRSNLGLLHCRLIFYCLSHLRSPSSRHELSTSYYCQGEWDDNFSYLNSSPLR